MKKNVHIGIMRKSQKVVNTKWSLVSNEACLKENFGLLLLDSYKYW